MELLQSIQSQLAALPANEVSSADELIVWLAAALRERYGPMAVAFAKRAPDQQLRLLGLVDGDGKLRLSPPEQFHQTAHHPSYPWPVNHLDNDWFALDVSMLDDTPLAAAGQFQQALIVPLLVNRPSDWYLGVLAVDPPPDANELSITANLLTAALLRELDVHRLKNANAWIDGEVKEIAKLQRLLQPALPIELNGIDVAVHAETYHYAGGDYFDVPRLTHLVPENQRVDGVDHWGAIIADVSGHGPSAAVEAAMLDAVMRTYRAPPEGAGPEGVAGYLNQYLFTRRPRSSFVTAFLCNYWPDSKTLRYINAGHPPPLLWPADHSSCSDLEVAPDIPLRVLRDYEWTRRERCMDTDDVLVLYTDGLIETRNAQNQEFGRTRLRQVVAAGSRDPQSIIDRVLHELQQHAQGKAVQDDQTLVVIRIN